MCVGLEASEGEGKGSCFPWQPAPPETLAELHRIFYTS